MKNIRRHRLDVAATLGYGCFADMSMDTKMAANVENVHAMIASLLARGEDFQTHTKSLFSSIELY